MWALNKCVPSEEEGMGIGLKTFAEIEEEDVIGPYVGTFSTSRPSGDNDYLMETEKGQWINAKKTGNNTRYINKSCKNREPNCSMKKKLYQGQLLGWLVAVRKIKNGEFLCFDYGPEYDFVCGCKLCVQR